MGIGGRVGHDVHVHRRGHGGAPDGATALCATLVTTSHAALAGNVRMRVAVVLGVSAMAASYFTAKNVSLSVPEPVIRGLSPPRRRQRGEHAQVKKAGRRKGKETPPDEARDPRRSARPERARPERVPREARPRSARSGQKRAHGGRALTVPSSRDPLRISEHRPPPPARRDPLPIRGAVSNRPAPRPAPRSHPHPRESHPEPRRPATRPTPKTPATTRSISSRGALGRAPTSFSAKRLPLLSASRPCPRSATGSSSRRGTRR